MCKQNRGKGGFTLVELLVVISIIAMLLAILMPSLQQARDQAKRILCASNMKQINLLLQMYAEDYSGKLPPYTIAELSNVEKNYAPKGPYASYFAYDFDGKDPAWTDNLATLYDLKYVTSTDVFYCSGQRDPYYIQKSYPEPWKTRPVNPPGTDLFSKVRSSYIYNPNVKKAMIDGTKTNVQMYRKIIDFPRDKIILTDVIHSQDGNVSIAHGKCGWNMSFIDGHSIYSTCQEAYDYMLKGDTWNDWPLTKHVIKLVQEAGN
ncbi:MAG: type II secretion system GspH family protein [Anaerohalosphaeraceae bacterium]|nr:type II secretion system GspH family protein [Anaerohalosphaeraceae bacterium]